MKATPLHFLTNYISVISDVIIIHRECLKYRQVPCFETFRFIYLHIRHYTLTIISSIKRNLLGALWYVTGFFFNGKKMFFSEEFHIFVFSKILVWIKVFAHVKFLL